jgi:glycosidase
MVTKLLLRLLLIAALVTPAADAFAILADAGHRPFLRHVPNANGTAEPRRQFREPYVEISNNPATPTTITAYTVVRRLNNPGYGTANQTGGTLFFKGQSHGVWQSVALSFHANEGDFQYWKASFSTSSIAANEVIQYYLYLTFDSGAENTYIYAPPGSGDLASQVTNSQATAATNPFTIRNRPAWIFHANNRVTSGNDVQFWAKVGYIGNVNDLNTRWVTNGAIYYTTNGTNPTPGAAPGTATGSTQVVQFSYSHPESNNMGDQSVAGTSMWWVANVPNLLQGLPFGTEIRYRIGFWHSSNNEQKFADHNAPANDSVFSFTYGTVGDPVLTINGMNANYTTSKLFIDEMANESVPLQIFFSPGQPATEVEVFTNLNRRDRAQGDANGDGIEDGIVPPDANQIAAGDDSHYYKAYVMQPSGSPGQYSLTLPANKTGAYRLTARWKVSGDPAWRWYTNGAVNRRDHAITVTPHDARNINLYEINTLNIEASGDTFAHRSTFEDLYDAPNAQHNFQGGGSRWNLDYLKNLGSNWLWFQPIHPPGIDGREINPNTGLPYDPGSPYAVKNFFEVNAAMSVHNSRAGAMAAFQGFVAAADQKGVGVMLDAPFNHTAYDVELSHIGVQLFAPAGNPLNWQPTDEIRDREARFFSRTGAYNQRATSRNDIAVAPDREDFGKWNDTKDVFFGVYAALVHSGQNGNYNNEGDWFDYQTSFGGADGAVTRNVWKYFAEYTLFWLDKTGVPAGSSMQVQTTRGIDGLRADFGQGLPPQAWEYITNKTRTRKWNFVFMSESLDGGAVTYRSNRHFDILNENIVFPFKDASSTSDYRGIFENRRNSYGLGLVLLNNTSHDEENYVDPWQALIRYAVAGTVDGVPMIFPGQELGISRTFGYDHYEMNFGKWVPHFKRYNSMMPAWNDTVFGNDQLYPVYSGIGVARLFSPALRSSNRFFLNQIGGSVQQQIFSVAKYQTRNASPATSDVVFGFVNINRNADQAGNFNINQDVDGDGVNDYGIKPNRTYDFKNLAAYLGSDPNRRNYFLNRKTGQQLLSDGLFVALNRVPTQDFSVDPSAPAWNQRPYEAQYLKLYDVTAPTTTPGAANPPNAYSYAIGSTVTLTWAAAPADSEGQAPAYRISGSDGSNHFTHTNSITLTGQLGQTITYTVQSVNPNDFNVLGPISQQSQVTFLDGNADHDGDGMSNAQEDLAGTNPFDPWSVFGVQAITRSSATSTTITWSSVPGKEYYVDRSSTPDSSGFAPITFVPAAAAGSTTTFTDTSATGDQPRFYRVRIGGGLRRGR